MNIELIKKHIEEWLELAGEKQTPFSAKILLLAAVVYFLSPIDLIPDFIPIIGYLDDLVIVPLLVWLALRQIEAYRVEHMASQKAYKNDETKEPNKLGTLS